jgi:hypothetical protein
MLNEATLTRAATACNPSGIAAGTYELTFALPDLGGVKVCGPAPVELRALAPLPSQR